jgi:tripartite-type tricarboxylate transporter receptor subunit TctC
LAHWKEKAMNRRVWLRAGGLGLAAGLLQGAQRAWAQAPGFVPQRPLRIVAGAAGAILDVAARQIADRLSASFGQPVIVENKPGAGGIAMMEAVARSAADGHTVAIPSFVELTVNPWLFDKLSYDPLRDFEPITALYTGPQMLVAHPSFAARSLPDLIRLAKAGPGKYQYGSSGVARPPHIFMEKFKLTAGLDLPHVPYRGGPPLLQAVLAAEVPLAMEGTSATLPLVQAGRLKALAVTGDRRLAALPDVPTFAEAGVAGIGLAWVGLVAPAGTPVPAIARWQQEVVAALAQPAVRAAYDAAGRTVAGNTPQEFGEWIRRDHAQWRDVVRQARIRPE